MEAEFDVTGPWGPPIAWSAEQIVAAGRTTLDRLRGFGVKIPPENRLERAGRCIEDTVARGWPPPTPILRRKVSEATRTIMEQYVILSCVNVADDVLRQTLRRLLEGPDVPSASPGTSPRDTQFELLMACILTLAGIDGIALGEPDVRIPVGDKLLGLAAKRLLTHKNATKQVRKAITQIRRQGFPGVIALSLEALTVDLEPDEATAAVSQLVGGVRDQVRMTGTEGLVAGAFGFAPTFHWFPKGQLGIEMISHTDIFAPPSEHIGIRAKIELMGQNLRRGVEQLMKEI